MYLFRKANDETSMSLDLTVLRALLTLPWLLDDSCKYNLGRWAYELDIVSIVLYFIHMPAHLSSIKFELYMIQLLNFHSDYENLYKVHASKRETKFDKQRFL